MIAVKLLRTDTLFIKLDGTFEWDSKRVYITSDGETILKFRKGTGRRTSQTTGEYEGEVRLITQSPKLFLAQPHERLLEGASLDSTESLNLESRGGTTQESIHVKD
jgi:hypothetical protein